MSHPALESGPIRVVHLLHTVAHGGIETILLNWLRAIDPAKVDVHMIVFANPGQTEAPFIRAAEKAGIQVRTIPWARRKPVFKSARALREILKELKTEIVHTHNVYAELVGYIAGRKVGAKVLNTLYVWADFGWKRNIQQWVSARLIRRFDLVTSQCQQTMLETTRRGVPIGIQKVLISGIEPNPVRYTPQERSEKRRALGINPEELVFVNVARLFPEKAQDHLLRSFKRICAQRADARLWILGVGPLEADLKTLAESLSISDRVKFPGFIPNMRDSLPLFDIQIHPSDAEGVPLAICEGMAAGLPIVATAVGGVPEMITHDISGLLVSARDEDALVRESIRLIDNPDLRRRLGDEARRFIEEDYSLERAVEILTETYEQLAGRPAGVATS